MWNIIRKKKAVVNNEKIDPKNDEQKKKNFWAKCAPLHAQREALGWEGYLKWDSFTSDFCRSGEDITNC